MYNAAIKDKLIFYARVAWFGAHLYSTYPWEIVSLLLRRTLEVGLLLLFWYIVQQGNGITEVRNFPAYILIASSAQLLTIGHNFRVGSSYGDDIKSGAISTILMKPINTLYYYVAHNFGTQIIVQAFSIINIIVGCFLLSGVALERYGLFVLSLFISWLIGLYLNVLIGAAAFWIIEHGQFRLILYFGVRIVSGFFVPLSFFPGAIEHVLLALPFAQLAYVPAEILTGTSSTGRLVSFLGIGVLWVVLLRLIAFRVWELGRRQNDAVGI